MCTDSESFFSQAAFSTSSFYREGKRGLPRRDTKVVYYFNLTRRRKAAQKRHNSSKLSESDLSLS